MGTITICLFYLPKMHFYCHNIAKAAIPQQFSLLLPAQKERGRFAKLKSLQKQGLMAMFMNQNAF